MKLSLVQGITGMGMIERSDTSPLPPSLSLCRSSQSEARALLVKLVLPWKNRQYTCQRPDLQEELNGILKEIHESGKTTVAMLFSLNKELKNK